MDFESSQIRWDQDDDGDIDVDDILAAFDTDGDGQIGSNELQKLAEQLSSQVDYNNMLIEHLKSMEEEQVRIQEDMKEKQNALKQAIAVGDAGFLFLSFLFFFARFTFSFFSLSLKLDLRQMI